MIPNQFDDHIIDLYFDYKPEEGAFYWKANPPGCSKSLVRQRAGTSPRWWSRSEGPQIKALGKRVRVSSMVWYKETGQWPISYIYHKDGNPNNCKFSNLTRHNPAWGGGATLDGENIYVGLVFKDGEWFVKKGREVEGPFPDMGQAMSRMRKIRER